MALPDSGRVIATTDTTHSDTSSTPEGSTRRVVLPVIEDVLQTLKNSYPAAIWITLGTYAPMPILHWVLMTGGILHASATVTGLLRRSRRLRPLRSSGRDDFTTRINGGVTSSSVAAADHHTT